MTAYFRSRRYAGSKDRRWISDHIYEILRRKGELDWAVAAVNLEPGARSELLLALLLFDGITADEIPSYFDGKFADAGLSEPENEIVCSFTKDALPPMPDSAAGNYPSWMAPVLKAGFGDDIVQQMKAFTEPAKLNLRANRLKTGRETVLARLRELDIVCEAAKYAPDGICIAGRQNITQQPLYKDGDVEIQDEAAQICARLVAAGPGMQVVDYCAGGGGKSLAIAADMDNDGLIYAFDIAGHRMRDINARAKRAGVDIIQAHVLDDEAGRALENSLAGTIERVIVDAPCSGSGTWRRQPDQKWRLTEAELMAYAAGQLDILTTASKLVKPGGRLIYATCSIFDVENGAVIDAFCQNHPQFSVTEVSEVWPQVGLSGDYVGKYLRMTPFGHGTDGFFTAILTRSA